MWVKLKKHIREGSIYYSTSLDSNELKFVEGKSLTCRSNKGIIERGHIEFMYIDYEEVKDGVKYFTKLKCPFFISDSKTIELDHVEINDEDIK